MEPRRIVRFAVIAAILAVYIALRFWNLTTSCLWFDEIFSIHAAEHSWNSILSFVAQDLIHPPLFYLLLKIWIALGGESLFWLRLFPVLFSILAIFPFLALCRELKLDLWPKIIAFLFFAVNGSLIKYSQEVRMYSLLLCLSLFSIWLFARYFQREELCSAPDSQYSDGLQPLFWLVCGLCRGLCDRDLSKDQDQADSADVRHRIYDLLTVGRCGLASVAIPGSELGQNIGWMTPPGFYSIVQFVLNLIEPFYYSASSVDPVSIYRISLPILLIVVCAVAFYAVGWGKHEEEERQPVHMLLPFVLLPLVVAFVVSWLLPYSIWGTRHLIIVFAPVAIIVGLAIARISNGTIRTAFATLLLLFAGYAFVLQSLQERPQYIWCAWEQLAESVDGNELAKIYVFEDLVAYHFWFALRDRSNVEVIKVENIPGRQRG